VKKLIIVLLLLMLSACGGSLDWSYNGADKCIGGPNLIISNLTPTAVTIPRSVGTMASFNLSMNVAGTACQNGIGHIDMAISGSRIAMTAMFPSAADTYMLRINNVMLDTTGLIASSGTFSIYITTASRTSNVVAGTIMIQ
jgi:hypothetical protein